MRTGSEDNRRRSILRPVSPAVSDDRADAGLQGIACPRCRADAIYRYGRTPKGRLRYLCKVCLRQFTAPSDERLPVQRPVCPSCQKPMHVYMRARGRIRFRCSVYPHCRTFRSVKTDPEQCS